MNSEPLMPIWEAYLVAVEALKVSKRVVTFSNKAKLALNALDDNEPEIIKRISFEKHKVGLNLLNRCTVIDQVTDLTLGNCQKIIIPICLNQDFQNLRIFRINTVEITRFIRLIFCLLILIQTPNS